VDEAEGGGDVQGSNSCCPGDTVTYIFMGERGCFWAGRGYCFAWRTRFRDSHVFFLFYFIGYAIPYNCIYTFRT